MKNRHGRVVCSVIALSVVSLAFLWGCEGTTRQGTLYNIQANRSLETYLPGDLKAVHEAALQAVQTDLGYTLGESAVDATEETFSPAATFANLACISCRSITHNS